MFLTKNIPLDILRDNESRIDFKFGPRSDLDSYEHAPIDFIDLVKEYRLPSYIRNAYIVIYQESDVSRWKSFKNEKEELLPLYITYYYLISENFTKYTQNSKYFDYLFSNLMTLFDMLPVKKEQGDTAHVDVSQLSRYITEFVRISFDIYVGLDVGYVGNPFEAEEEAQQSRNGKTIH